MIDEEVLSLARSRLGQVLVAVERGADQWADENGSVGGDGDWDQRHGQEQFDDSGCNYSSWDQDQSDLDTHFQQGSGQQQPVGKRPRCSQYLGKLKKR
jgi:hypothetical protein